MQSFSFRRPLRDYLSLLIPALLLGSIIWVMESPVGSLPPLGLFLDVWNGAYHTARLAEEPKKFEANIPGLSAPVQVLRDERGVPHIFAQNDRDAALTLGYLTAKDRLFQMDFQTRYASGRLSEVLGESMIENDKYLRRTGMMLGAERTWEAMQKNSSSIKDILEAYSQGVNAWIDGLSPQDVPFEFRLLGYKPEAWKPINTVLVNQVMAMDLCFPTKDVGMTQLADVIGWEAVQKLYPNHSPMPEPQSPEPKGVARQNIARQNSEIGHSSLASVQQSRADAPHEAMQAFLTSVKSASELYAEAMEGKGSNNWVATGTKTQSGKPLLAGDPHLGLSLPAIWYEAHISTPTQNVYGVTIPGAPAIIIGFNDYLAWSPTNTGADVLDFYTVTFEDTKQQRYKYMGEWKPVREEIRPIRVKGKPEVADTMRFTHWGPVITQNKKTLSIRWTAHEASTIMEAIGGFNHAKNWSEFQAAQRKWDVPAQNIVYADREGNIALRSCGYYPIRKQGHGKYIQNGETDEGEWIGRIPFDSIPASVNPSRAWLESANQEPVPPDYPYYLGYAWTNPWRAMRISERLQAGQHLVPKDFQALQTEVESMQFRFIRDMMRTCGAAETITEPVKKQAVERLLAWNGMTSMDSKETLLFKLFWDNFASGTWDEIPDSIAGLPPQDVLITLARSEPESIWFDDKRTPEHETASDICKRSLKMAADTLIAKYGANPDGWTWGKHHSLVIRHLLRTGAVKPLWRGPFPFPGFNSTVLPASGWQATHSASWRMVADFKDGGKPTVQGVFPGGPSGNPFSRFYDSQVQTWLEGRLYQLYVPTSVQDFDRAKLSQELVFTPKR